MPGQLTGYICTCCGFIIIELKPVSPWCPLCAMWGRTAGRMEAVADAGAVKFLAVVLHVGETTEPAPIATLLPELPATD